MPDRNPGAAFARHLPVILLALATSSCKQAAPAASVSNDPAASCAGPQTAAGLANLVFKDAEAETPDVKGVGIAIEAPVLDSFDQTTKRVSCTANLAPAYPAALKVFDKQPLQVNQASYTIQPTADNSGMMYTLQRSAVIALQDTAGAVIAEKIAASQQSPSTTATAPSPAPESQNVESSKDQPATHQSGNTSSAGGADPPSSD